MLSKSYCFMWVSALYQPDFSFQFKLPLYGTCASAGFPQPGDESVETRLNLNNLVIDHPAATFFAHVSGDSMRKAGIFHGDIVVVDRSLEAADGKVVLAVVNGEMLIKRMLIQGGRLFLMAENPDYAPLEVTAENDFHVWGVVTNVVHKL